MIAHARETAPEECCGLIGGVSETLAASPVSTSQRHPESRISLRSRPEDLFAAQRQMRERGEELLAIYHSHPRSLIQSV